MKSVENRWWVLAVVSSALFLITVDMTVLYIALPTLTRDLGATSSEKLWIMNAYALVVAGLLPGLGTLGDRIGHKRMMLGGLIVFGLASTAAAYAPSASFLITARAALGIGAAMMMPATLSIIRITFSDTRERALAFGVWGAVSAGGAALGPVIGGILLEYFHWGSVFLINVPVVIAGGAAVSFLLRKDTPGENRPWSPLASLLILVGLSGIIFAIKEGGNSDGSLPRALAAGCIGTGMLILFARRQRTSRHPLIDFSLFRDGTFSFAVASALLLSLVMIGVEMALSQWLQLVAGLAPISAALAVLPLPVAALFGGPLAGVALPRLGAGKLVGGMLLATEAGLLCLFLAQDGGWLYISGLMLMGLGAGGGMSAASNIIMSRASANQAGMAASIEEVSFELGGALGIAVFGTILSVVYSYTLLLPQELELPALEGVYDSLDTALRLSESLPAEGAWELVSAARASFDKAFSVVLATAVALLAIVSAALAYSGMNRAQR